MDAVRGADIYAKKKEIVVHGKNDRQSIDGYMKTMDDALVTKKWRKR